VIREIVPVYLGEIEGRKVYDAGENITGWAIFEECGAKGDKITLRYAEEVYPDGSLNFESTGGLKQVQTDSFVSAGKKDLCVPHFTWHGFRYFDVE
jgi:alpha-L-rhamnosidase